MKEWVTGRNPVYETLRARRRHFFRLWISQGSEVRGRLADIIRLAADNRLKPEIAPRVHLDRLGENHQGVAIEVSSYPYSTLTDILQLSESLQEPLFILVLDTIQNPQNLGSLLRTAEAMGVHGVLIPLARAAGVTPAVVTASAGACEHIQITAVNLAQGLEQIKQSGGWVIGLEGGPQSQLPENIRLSGPLALVVGGEGEGLRPLVRKSCDVLLALPMRGRVESLNAAVAGSIGLYLAYEARRNN
jgi:23S rRNA (guanosine2251-2'-O)-methyltransferase